MYVSPQDYLDPISMGNGLSSGLSDLGNDLEGVGSMLGSTQGDDVARFTQPIAGMAQGALSASQALSPMSMFAPLLGGIGSLLQSLGGLFGGGPQQQRTSPTTPHAGARPQSGQQFFSNATASSTGDPHLSFNGTNGAGNSSNAKWDSMASHQDLLDSNSFSGGYRVSTTATAPNSSGVTYNQSATVSTRNGHDSVSLDAGGNASVSRNGQSYSIADGQSMSLGSGETVSRAQNGNLTIDDATNNGGSISTTLSENGHGVDVNVQADNVDLGGDLAGGSASTPAPQPAWVPQPPQNIGYAPNRRYPMDNASTEVAAME